MKIIANYYLKKYTLDIEPSNTILDIKNKLDLGNYIIIKYFGRIKKNNETAEDIGLEEGSHILVRDGYTFYVTFDNKKYELQGEGCTCCGGGKDLLYRLMAKETGISKEDFNLVHDNVILEREYGLKKTDFTEFDMVLKENIKKIKIKCGKDIFIYITYKDLLTYDKLFTLFAESNSRRLFGVDDIDLSKGMEKRFKTNKIFIFNGKILDENEDLNKIENLDELIIIKKPKEQEKTNE